MNLKPPLILVAALCCHPLARGSRKYASTCPHVAGIAALILERNPYLTVTQVNDIIEKSTDKVGDMPYNENRKNGTWNSHYGYGMVNAYKAVMNTPRP